MLSLTFLAALAWKNRAVPIYNSGVSIVRLEDLYNALLKADTAWNRELRRRWGRNANKARFDMRGVLTPRLRALHDEYKAAAKSIEMPLPPATKFSGTQHNLSILILVV